MNRLGGQRRQSTAEALVAGAGVVTMSCVLIGLVALPLTMLLVKSVQNSAGAFVGLDNYIRYVSTPALLASVWNTLWISTLVTLIVVPLAFAYAYALTRTTMALKGLFSALALIPLFVPSLLPALSFIYIFGNQGFLKSWLFGASVYGPIGIVLAQIFNCFPHAVLVLVTALSLADARLYEAAEALGASRARRFVTVTLPGVSYGLMSASFLVFTLVMTDFGIAKVIGGRFDVLATDVYKQVIGQQSFEMGAVVGTVLLLPAVLTFVVDRYVRRRQVALLTSRAVPFVPARSRATDRVALAYCALMGGLLLAVFAVAVWGSLVTYWPYNLSLTLKHYDFGEYEPNGWAPYLNSLKMAALAALLGTVIVAITAYLIEKQEGWRVLRGFVQFLATLPMAVPGLVLGLGYVFLINAPWNPLGVLYGSLFLLSLNSVAHFYTTAHLTATTALKQIDREFEAVSASLGVPFYRTFWRVTVPISLPAMLDIATYLFVNALTTVAAVIFLYGPASKLAAVTVVHMDESGATASAAAMATLLALTAVSAKLLHLALHYTVVVRVQRWRQRG